MHRFYHLDCENFVFKMVGDNGRDMTLKECQDYVNELAPKAPASLTKQFTNVDVPNTSRFVQCFLLIQDKKDPNFKIQNTDFNFRKSQANTNLRL